MLSELLIFSSLLVILTLSAPTLKPRQNRGGVLIQPTYMPNSTVSVNSYNPGAGSIVSIAYDVTTGFPELDGPFSGFQAFHVPSIGLAGSIQIHMDPRVGYGEGDGDFLCLDAGVDPSEGRLMKLWKCEDGFEQQSWVLNRDGSIELEEGRLCLEVDMTSGPIGTGHWPGQRRSLIIMKCDERNLYQSASKSPFKQKMLVEVLGEEITDSPRIHNI